MKNNYFSVQRIVLIVTIVLFSILTVLAVQQFGLMGIFQEAFQNLATVQVFVDLFLSLVLILIWMYFDAKKLGRKFWPWLLITLAIGVFGPLLYLLFRKSLK